MPKISQEEKDSATLIPLERLINDVDDAEQAFNEFRESFQTGDEPGIVRAWELMIDDRGNVGTTKMQTKLGSWPIDAYKLDELCQMIVDQYMTPDQSRMAVRLVGTRKEQTGYVFNKIMLLKRAIKKESSSNGSESTASIMKMMQENNERMIAMFQRMQAPPTEKPDTMAEIQKMLAFSNAMNAPMMGMLQSLLPALAGRPAPTAGPDPFASVGSLLDVAERLSEIRGGGASEGGDDNSFAGILRAITPLAKPALEALPALAAMQAANRPPPRVIAASVRPPPNAPVAVPPAPPPNAPVPSGAPLQPTDIPSGDSAMLAQLKPQIDALVSMASQGSPPTDAADLLFDQVFLTVPEEIFERLANFVDSETFVNYVCVMNPAAKPHAAWFEAFKTQIIARLNAEDQSDEPGAGQIVPTPGLPGAH